MRDGLCRSRRRSRKFLVELVFGQRFVAAARVVVRLLRFVAALPMLFRAERAGLSRDAIEFIEREATLVIGTLREQSSDFLLSGQGLSRRSGVDVVPVVLPVVSTSGRSGVVRGFQSLAGLSTSQRSAG